MVWIGFCVADKPMRCSFRPHKVARRSSDRLRWTPRLFGATAWISSTITERVTRGYLSMLMSGTVQDRDPVNYPPAGRVNV